MWFFQIVGMIFNGLWSIANLSLNIDGLVIKLWHFPLFFIVLAYITRLIFDKKEDSK